MSRISADRERVPPNARRQRVGDDSKSTSTTSTTPLPLRSRRSTAGESTTPKRLDNPQGLNLGALSSRATRKEGDTLRAPSLRSARSHATRLSTSTSTTERPLSPPRRPVSTVYSQSGRESDNYETPAPPPDDGNDSFLFIGIDFGTT
jgi:hypothetical protein